MLDTTNTDLTKTQAWRDHVSPGDIISFRFRIETAARNEEAPPRPCLILEIEHLAGRRYALIAYGTSSPPNATWAYEVHALHEDEYPCFGLRQPTRFLGKRRLLVSLDNPGFVICRRSGSPVLGRLAGGPFERLQAVRARIQAYRDMAADRLAERERRRRESFVVQHPQHRRRALEAAGGRS